MMSIARITSLIALLSAIAGVAVGQGVSQPGVAASQGAPSDQNAGKPAGCQRQRLRAKVPANKLGQRRRRRQKPSMAARQDARAQPAQAPASNFKFTVIVDPATAWRPQSGNVKFAVKGPAYLPGDTDIMVCMRWTGSNDGWHPTPLLRLAESADANATTYEATVPTDLDIPARTEGLEPLTVKTVKPSQFSALGIVPLADSPRHRQDARWAELVLFRRGRAHRHIDGLASLCLLLSLSLDYSLRPLGCRLCSPGAGPRHVVLQIISTQSGYASLSQLQIILWTLVIGWASAYVLVISGNLVPLTPGTLVLLGITGGAAVIAKAQSALGMTASTASSAAPDAVVRLDVQSLSDTEIRLAWAPASTGASTDFVDIDFQVAQTPPSAVWVSFAAAYGGTAVRIVGLQPATAYNFRVTAKNDVGGDKSTVNNGSTLGSQALPSTTITAFGPTEEVANTSAWIHWTVAAAAPRCQVQVRRRETGRRVAGCAG